MLAFVTSYWFVTLPTALTGLILIQILNQTREEMATRARVPATIARKK